MRKVGGAGKCEEKCVRVWVRCGKCVRVEEGGGCG